MFTLGIPERQYRRATQVLANSKSKPISYEERKQEDGFYVWCLRGDLVSLPSFPFYGDGNWFWLTEV